MRQTVLTQLNYICYSAGEPQQRSTATSTITTGESCPHDLTGTRKEKFLKRGTRECENTHCFCLIAVMC